MLRLTRRTNPSRSLEILAPLVAVALTLVVAAILFVALGKNPADAFAAMFWRPVQDLYGWSELGVKVAPLILCAVGLAIGFRASVWNIGAEGQIVVGAIAASWVALAIGDGGFGLPGWLLPLLAGALGGMAWGAIPALLRTKANANEILVSLMLVYVGGFLLQYVVRGPMRDPMSFGFPQSPMFPDPARLPILLETTRLHLGFALALLAALVAWLFVARSYQGFVFRLSGVAPAAAAYAGFSRSRVIWGSFLISGGLAGLAGAAEVLGPIGQLQPAVSPGYGFAAIIVAFLGRLHPIGIVAAALLMGLFYLGGEIAQLELQLPIAITGVFQGLLLFFLLGADTFVRWRLVLGGTR
ncbi:ABC transporter permease [Geminicoccus flavidas]|uniref:ABC transporter permease n=1 Tax=Geminicoccus flavidas TaxID=2506407 RepID=UPI001358260D|nr:ABC transporter permease [Geminicoccus flavidas]